MPWTGMSPSEWDPHRAAVTTSAIANGGVASRRYWNHGACRAPWLDHHDQGDPDLTSKKPLLRVVAPFAIFAIAT